MEILNTIYTKQNKQVLFEEEANPHGLFSLLSMNPKNWKTLKQINKFLYYIEPLHTLILTYFLVPRQENKYFKYFKKDDEENLLDKIHEKLRKHLKYSEHEYSYVKPHITNLINRDIEKWGQKLAIKE